MEKVAVIGLGNIAIRHRSNLKRLFPDATLFAMSASGRVPQEIISDCDILVSNVQDLVLHEVELVIVASPAPFHASHALPLIEAGIPVLIEKPVTVTKQDASELQQAMEEHQTPVAVGYCLRYLSSAIQVKKLLVEHAIGVLYNAHIEIGQYLPNWRPNKNYYDSVSSSRELGGGALLELSHELDYAQWLLGPLTLQHSILRSSVELGLDVEDMVDIVALNQSKTVVTFHLDFIQREAYRRCSFIGSKGRLEWDLIKNSVTLATSEGVRVVYNGFDWDKNKMYLEMIEDFVQLIKGNKNSCTTLDEAKKTVCFISDVKKNAEYIES
ncbi:Gfo/Idh/MocA family protein [Vibrio sp. T11.5]|uniref:Gfo/Idh/MocA family protein n=1 Tax=Vibrio sp. T11.5 TaxID=2998836 RepID=UPI0022CD6C50|nr:Gfo/Idh/MocA family oxidoreductase [Vibrio sp. T11.5]MDA0120162.1 Gfo/Idh/MocA family oxidoreductase [Vibrio sp. T11.5]